MRRIIYVSLLLLLVPSLLLAQTTGSINGKVTDEEGTAIAGAVVTATSLDSGLEREVKTDRNGNYVVALLPVGNWTVTITAAGMQPQVTSFRLGVGEKVPVNATMMPGEIVTEEVNVYSTATAMNTSGTQTNVDFNAVEELPVNNRTLNVIARLSGHVSEATQTGTALTVAGAPSYDTTVLLDGAEISDPFFGTATTVYLEDAVEEVQVLTSGISARYGRFQGGIINAITKSGSNEWEATLRYEFDKDSWNQKTPFGETLSDTLNETYQLTAGGYLWKDHIWFFGGYREIPATATSRTATFSGAAYTTNATEDRWQAKLRGAIASNHVVDISHLEFSSTTDPWAATNLGPATLDVVNGKRGDPRETNTLAYQGVLTPSLFLEVQATQKDAAIFAGGAPNGKNPFLDLNTLDVYNNYWWDFSDLDVRNNETAAANLTYSLSTNNAGTHTLEFGIQSVDSITSGENKQTPADYNLLGFNADFIAGPDAAGNPTFNLRNFDAARWTALPLGGEQTIENVGIYVQDTINLGDWRFDVGLRWDDYQGAGVQAISNMSFDKIVPRLGVTKNITDNWQLGATWGQYVARFNDNFAQGASGVGSAPSLDQFYTGPDMLGISQSALDALLSVDSAWDFTYGYNGPGTSTIYLADQIHAPYAEEFTLSVRRSLPNNSGTVVVSWVDRDYKDSVSQYQGEVCNYSNFTFTHETESCADGSANYTPILGGTLGEVDTTVWANDARNIRTYQGISVQANYAPTSRWNVGGSYTYSLNQGNYEGEGANTPASGGSLGLFPRSVDNVAPYGFVDEDLTHRTRAYGSYRFDFGRAGGLVLGGVLAVQSGTRWSNTATVSSYPIPEYVGQNSTFTQFFSDRGANRFDSWQSLGLSARYDFNFFSKFGMWVKAQVNNVTNEDTLLTYQTTGRAVSDGGNLVWAPSGTCGLDDTPSKSCSSFGRISTQNRYQTPRQYFFTIGLRY